MAADSKPVLEYATPPQASRRRVASVLIAVAVAAFTAAVTIWGDPFQSMGNEKPVRIAYSAGILGVFVAVRDIARKEDSSLPTIGLIMNGLAILAASIFLPYI